MKKNGFTLIELLIVIVIIGILAGVLVSVIDPVRQQNRSKNATIRAGLNKLAFAINTTKSGLGRLPDEVSLTEEVENITLISGCDITGELDCAFDYAGTILPKTCGAGSLSAQSSGVGASDCHFRILSLSTLSNGEFRIYAKKYKLENTDPEEVYVFDSRDSLYVCDAFASIDSTTPISDIDGCASVNADDVAN